MDKELEEAQNLTKEDLLAKLGAGRPAHPASRAPKAGASEAAVDDPSNTGGAAIALPAIAVGIFAAYFTNASGDQALVSEWVKEVKEEEPTNTRKVLSKTA